ncbi:MAG: imidazole glycerol-phosphate synthase subunit HisH [Acidobacteriota bacterium]|jgi:glutamine amidotransferase|nr:imidazole glycerol-phosphate synthase subunit HisH [Acidobacteriota bacterium]
MLVTLIDSPVANTANIARALRAVGAELQVTRDRAIIAAADKLVLPGVGSFVAARSWLAEHGIDEAIDAAVAGGAALLGICVGHQLLFDVSYEMGTTRGLGLVRGAVERFGGTLPVPQIGWNRVAFEAHPLFAGVAPSTSFYFVNSYAGRTSAHEIASAAYDGAFTAAVQNGRVLGVQFHPEKSSTAGLRVLRNYVELQP